MDVGGDRKRLQGAGGRDGKDQRPCPSPGSQSAGPATVGPWVTAQGEPEEVVASREQHKSSTNMVNPRREKSHQEGNRTSSRCKKHLARAC